MKKTKKSTLTVKEAEEFLKAQGFREMPLAEYRKLMREIKQNQKEHRESKARSRHTES